MLSLLLVSANYKIKNVLVAVRPLFLENSVNLRYSHIIAIYLMMDVAALQLIPWTQLIEFELNVS